MRLGCPTYCIPKPRGQLFPADVHQAILSNINKSSRNNRKRTEFNQCPRPVHQSYLLNKTCDTNRNIECLCVRIHVKQCKNFRPTIHPFSMNVMNRTSLKMLERDGYTPHNDFVNFSFDRVFMTISNTLKSQW